MPLIGEWTMSDLMREWLLIFLCSCREKLWGLIFSFLFFFLLIMATSGAVFTIFHNIIKVLTEDSFTISWGVFFYQYFWSSLCLTTVILLAFLIFFLGS